VKKKLPRINIESLKDVASNGAFIEVLDAEKNNQGKLASQVSNQDWE
jgi:hypothetical protein